MSNLSKNKGRAFEYVVRDKCSDTFKSQFERVPLSGALTYLKGDVYAPWLPDFPWTIEAKHHKEVDWNNILTAKSNLLLEFWDQTTREAKVMNKLPLLVYKWDRSKIDNYVLIQSANRKFHMGLFDDWLEAASKIYTKPN
jgi:hypothetical protein